MPAKLSPEQREEISRSRERTHVLAERYGVSVSRVKEIRAAAGWSRDDDRGGNLPGTPKHPNTGRRPGAPLKRTVEARETIAKHGASPVEALARTMNDESVPLELRMTCAKALLPYAYPRLASVEVTGRDGDAIKVEHDHDLCLRLMADDVLVERLEAIVIERAEQERDESGVEAVYQPELPSGA